MARKVVTFIWQHHLSILMTFIFTPYETAEILKRPAILKQLLKSCEALFSSGVSFWKDGIFWKIEWHIFQGKSGKAHSNPSKHQQNKDRHSEQKGGCWQCSRSDQKNPSIGEPNYRVEILKWLFVSARNERIPNGDQVSRNSDWKSHLSSGPIEVCSKKLLFHQGI